MHLTNKLTVNLRQFIEFYLLIQRRDISKYEAYVLSYIMESHPIAFSMEDDAREAVLEGTKMKSSYLSQVLKKLIEKGMIERQDKFAYFIINDGLKQICEKLLPKINNRIALTYEFSIYRESSSKAGSE